jgi:diketogulonate reductase-like aldo/keto reductase
MGESAATRADEVAAVRLALRMGYRLIDTAEMYGDGGAESVIGEALGEALVAGEVERSDLFIVSKVVPHNATRLGLPQACERSLRRLRLDRIDLYLLHWRGNVPLVETITALEKLRVEGRIRHWGVSNFDLQDLQRLWRLPLGRSCAVNQVYYSLTHRGVEFDLLPWMRSQRLPLMAYCPIDQGDLAGHAGLDRLAKARGVTAAQLALAWMTRQPQVMAIPKATSEAHLRENLEAVDLTLSDAEQQQIDRMLPPPRSSQPLAVV